MLTLLALVAVSCDAPVVVPPAPSVSPPAPESSESVEPQPTSPRGAEAANVDASEEPRGWGILELDATLERQLAGREGEVFRAGPEEVFVVVRLRLEKLRPGEQDVPSTGASLLDEGEFPWPASGFGEEDTFCVGCAVEYSTTSRVVPIALVFEIPFEAASGMLLLQWGADDVAAAAGWRMIEPGGRTECGYGGRYAFWVNRGDPDRLLVFFQGGGGCFNYRSCAPGTSLFDPDVGSGDDPAVSEYGILDLTRTDNPFRGWTVVFVPSCTGDVYWGDAVHTYRSRGREVTVSHRGFVNASAALAWAYRNVPDPTRVFLSGCSAGSVGSAAHAPFVIERYPDASVTQLGDSLAFVFHRPLDLQSGYRAHDNFPSWIPALERIEPGEFQMAEYYLAIAQHYPNHTFGEVNFTDDVVQELFYEALGGDPDDFPADLRRTVDRIAEGAPNFVSYTAPGSEHCVVDQPGFFSLEVAGEPLRDWVEALSLGRPVDHVGR